MADTPPSGPGSSLNAVEKALRKRYGLPDTASQAEVEERMNQVQVETLLTGITDFIDRHIDLHPQFLDTVVLWAVATHSYLHFRYYPYLLITSPTHGSGKSTLLDALKPVALNGYRTGGITKAGLQSFAKTSTLLLDEIDSNPRDFRDLVQVLNQGFERGVPVTQKKQNYDVYGPKALAGNEPTGLLPPTESRTLPIYMLRSRPGHQKVPLTSTNADWNIRLAATNVDAVQPQMDHLMGLALGTLARLGIENRTKDLWLPLFVWAHAAGAAWVDRAIAAMKMVEGGRPRSVQPGAVVLDALRDVFAIHGNHVASVTLVAELNNHDDVKDARLRLDPIRLASLLRPFRIQRRVFRDASGTQVRGYFKEDFTDAWVRWPRQ